MALLIASAAGIEMLANVATPDAIDGNLQVLAEESGELVAGTLILAGASRLASWTSCGREPTGPRSARG